MDSWVRENEEHLSPSSGKFSSTDQAKDYDQYPVPGYSQHQQPPPAEKRLNQILLGVIVVLLVAVVTFSALLVQKVSKSTGSAQKASALPRVMCNSEACQRVVRQLRRGLFPTSPPCKDFYQYVCGAWDGPAYEGDELFQKLVDDVGEASQAQTIPHTGQSATQKAAMAYQSCVDIVSKNSTSMATVRRILEEAGFFAWPPWHTPAAILNASFFLAVTWRIASPFKIEYMRLTKLGLVLRLGPSLSVLAYVRRRHQPNWETRSKDDFKEMEGTFQPDREPKITYDQWKTTDDEVTNDWTEKLATMRSGEELQGWNESTIHEAVWGMSREDWFFLLSTYFNRVATLTFYVDSPELFSSFARLPTLVRPEMAQAYYRWYMVEILASIVYAPWIIRRHSDYESALKHQRRFCFGIVEKSVGYAFLAPYIQKTFSTKVIDDIANLLRQVRGAYGDLFDRSEYFRTITKSLPSYISDAGHVLDLFQASDDTALEKKYCHYGDMTSDPLENWRKLRIGLTNSFLGDVTMDSAGTAIEGLRYYISDNLNFDFTLRPDVAVIPFFDPSLPVELKLAGLGSIMASAITDSFYATQHMWTPPSLEAWNQRIACMQERGLPEWSVNEIDLLKRTVALETVVKALGNSSDGLKDLPELSGTRLLFVAWCHLQCGDSLGRQLCNEPILELNSFGDAFKCDVRARMRANWRCTDGQVAV
ncbi:uncharacterized protein LOC144166639 [Haemaphysalis longicornis]